MRSAAQVPWLRPTKLFWLPAIGGTIAVIAFLGTPHLLWTYRYSGSSTEKYFLSCSYVGYDSQTVIPVDGKCPVIVFLKAASGGSDG